MRLIEEIYEEIRRIPILYAFGFALIYVVAFTVITSTGGDEQASEVVLPEAVVRVDADAWGKTLEALERAYAESCNEAVARLYRGDRARGFQGYVCKPVRGTMFVEFEGRVIGWEPVRLPWRVER